jgi:hypothetical protein
MLATDGLEATMNRQVRQFIPPALLRANDTLNGTYALFVDDLFAGATSFAKHYQALNTFDSSVELFNRWKQRRASLRPGDEYDLVDTFAEHLGMTDWYTWREDRGLLPAEDLDLSTAEGVTNPQLLEQKAPASVMYLVGALQAFDGLSESKVKEIAFEIAMRGREGIDYSDPERKHSLASMPGRELTGLQMLCFMYAGFKRFAPEMDPGIDLAKEYAEAVKLHRSST